MIARRRRSQLPSTCMCAALHGHGNRTAAPAASTLKHDFGRHRVRSTRAVPLGWVGIGYREKIARVRERGSRTGGSRSRRRRAPRRCLDSRTRCVRPPPDPRLPLTQARRSCTHSRARASQYRGSRRHHHRPRRRSVKSRALRGVGRGRAAARATPPAACVVRVSCMYVRTHARARVQVAPRRATCEPARPRVRV